MQYGARLAPMGVCKLEAMPTLLGWCLLCPKVVHMLVLSTTPPQILFPKVLLGSGWCRNPFQSRSWTSALSSTPMTLNMSRPRSSRFGCRRRRTSSGGQADRTGQKLKSTYNLPRVCPSKPVTAGKIVYYIIIRIITLLGKVCNLII